MYKNCTAKDKSFVYSFTFTTWREFNRGNVRARARGMSRDTRGRHGKCAAGKTRQTITYCSSARGKNASRCTVMKTLRQSFRTLSWKREMYSFSSSRWFSMTYPVWRWRGELLLCTWPLCTCSQRTKTKNRKVIVFWNFFRNKSGVLTCALRMPSRESRVKALNKRVSCLTNNVCYSSSDRGDRCFAVSRVWSSIREEQRNSGTTSRIVITFTATLNFKCVWYVLKSSKLVKL